MINNFHNNIKIVLSGRETLVMLQGFCNEALRFLKVNSDRYPMIKVGGAVAQNGKINPIVIDYDKGKVLVTIPIFKMMFASSTGNDAPTMFRMMGYQLARFWYRYQLHGVVEEFNPMDIDSVTFAFALMSLKGLNVTPFITTLDQILKMLKSEFRMECKLVECFEKNTKQKQKLISFSDKEIDRKGKYWQELRNSNITRPLECISEGQLGSKTNPFKNVDDAAAYVLRIEKERLLTDSYRQAVANEEYFFDGYSFRFPWASANVSYYPIEGAPRNCFVANQLITHGKFSLKPSLAYNKFLYRGQSQHYSECKPNLFRTNKDYFVDDMIQINEMECLLKTHPLVKLFEQGFQLFNDSIRIKIYYKGLSQHYYNKTNLLDLTSNIEVAKFFAVTDFCMEQDKYIKYTGNQLGVLYYFDLKADSFQPSCSRTYVIDTIGKQPFMRSGNQCGFTINLGKNDNFDNFPEVRFVFFRHDQNITERIYQQFDKGDKIMPEEILRSHWYNRMSNDELMHTVSNDALKLNYENNKHESHNKICKALQNKNYRIKNYHPTFTDEELDIYYSSAIKNWEEFCKDIYFYSPEGMIMKEYLYNLPSDPRYKWAFVR
ncbi:MAG: FRG domain-containing protein [Bacteroidales bacterium]|nr:FRG domain-containing protein [Bacteroidales bacterium]